MNRGIAKRTLFETDADIRFFLSRLAKAVRARLVEIHAFCILTTHFHLLVRSPAGDLSRVLGQAQLEYVRRFNRQRRRDGPLVRGRFTSRPVTSIAYRKILVRYIDANPVSAGICSHPVDYAFGSARHYSGEDGPVWLSRAWIESVVREACGRDVYEPTAYARAFGRSTEADERLIARRSVLPAGPDRLDDLVHSTPSTVLSWMRWKTRLADGTEPGLPVVDLAEVDRAIREARESGLEVLLRTKRVDLLRQMHAGMLREACGASLVEIAARLGCGTSYAGELCRRHVLRLESDEAYAQRAARILHGAIHSQHGTPSRHGDSTDLDLDDHGTARLQTPPRITSWPRPE